MTASLEQAVDAITTALHARDLPAAWQHFGDAVQGRRETLDALVRQLAATVVTPAGLVVWGFGLDIWANPYRDVDEYAWRCGDCRLTASHYRTDKGAQASAAKHAAERHPSRTPKVVSYMDEAYWDAAEAAGAGT